MKVFKFGGASVNSADAVRNMAQIVQKHLESTPLVVVVSAMGKTTNLLEKLVPGSSDITSTKELRQQLEEYHREIASSLMPENKEVQHKIDTLLSNLDHLCTSLPTDVEHHNYCYDQVVCHGELLSTTIIAEYLNTLGINTLWTDARQLIKTDNHYREGRVDWNATEKEIKNLEPSIKNSYSIVLTQGFIGGTTDGQTTTLGREGSDYSAAILAHCLDAESVTIWKDVPGFLNADPKFFIDTVKISQIPYNEAIELAYYGASVIHPKTVKPIQNKGIPLYIRSFITVGQDRTMLSLDFTPVGGLDENDENDDDEEEMEQEENLSSDLRESLPLGSEADDALDDTIDNPVTLPTHTDTLSS